MSKSSYIDYVLDLLLPLGNIKVRKMFGGYGIYQNGIFFAIIADNVLYFKVGENNRSNYENYGSKPFTYEGKNKKMVVMSYWQVPVDILESQSQLAQWVADAVKAARQAKK